MINGVINIYKEKGYTSHDVVAKLRGIVGQRKIGHTGTLDPDAVGVLPVCLGKATKICGLLTEKEKVYETVLLLGRTTDTQDISGEVISEQDPSSLEQESVQNAILSFSGEYDQVPPMYSAVKVEGKKLYELAREGKIVERKPRKVFIHEIKILEYDLPRVKLEVRCSKGTYIRTLCHDIGVRLGCGGCMEYLKRTRSGDFEEKDSLTLDEVIKKRDEGTLMEAIYPIDRIFLRYPAGAVVKEWEKCARNGGILPKYAVMLENAVVKDDVMVRLYDEEHHFIALYMWKLSGQEYRIVKMFFQDKSEEK